MDPDTLASADVTTALQQLESSAAASKATGYNELLTKIIDTSAPDTLAPNLIAYVESLLGDTLGIVASRPLLASFVARFRELQDADVKIEVGTRALALLAPKVVSYEEQDTAIKEILADAYQDNEDFIASAKILQAIPLDSSQRTISPDDKAAVWIRIVRCYLEEDDPTSATTYLNRVKNILHSVTDKATKLQFQLSQARIHDSQRSFLDASAAYHQISNELIIDEEERLRALSAAIVCAVLAPAGPQRARTLARLYKDDRASQVDEYAILEKIFLDRLLTPGEVSAFAAKLQPHQLAKTSDGSTVLDKAVLEHNLLAASRLYSNIGIDQLAELLNVDADRAESYAAGMIEQGRLAGYIDQIARYIFFEGEGSGHRKAAGHQFERLVGGELRKWDENVRGLAEEVERVTTMVQSQHPEFYAKHMVV
ncbi:Cop9 signalosome complex subunit 4 [Neofusicoccum parvum]|uniref:COP9 signalosome complex subunit 4 n=2 Tax=Neofusicoccum TaxID=407951 RepID=R1EMN9_BOTPV|nr:putative cop9 signalosome subunit protein [Neofusicoccum parvum UCRNP2]GME49080.1 Cop9 signalosome complex subunit 4 [Neofusicoccum parvum]